MDRFENRSDGSRGGEAHCLSGWVAYGEGMDTTPGENAKQHLPRTLADTGYCQTIGWGGWTGKKKNTHKKKR